MNAPFSPSGPNPSGDEPELRALLDAEARRQPPVSPDLRSGVDRRVRRHRTRLAVAVAPVLAVVLVGAVLLAPRSTPDATLQTAAEPTESTEPGEVVAPEPSVPAPAADGFVDCGSVELGPERIDPETGPIDCFIEAFNADGDARLVVLVNGPDGGTLTETVTTAPGRQVNVAIAGSLSVQFPDVGFGTGGGGLVPAEPDGPGEDCGTFTYVEGTTAQEPSDEAISCLLGLFLSGSGGGFTAVTTDATGGTLTMRVDLSAERLLTVSFDGALTQTLPAELVVPADLTDQLPPNGFGLDELGLDGRGGVFPGAKPGS